ncbi:MAG: hypothetical protein JNK20_07425 [Flavipsychrobacter sp.]|nr:hypothetical protein [Flavipsychrobacter sp.]
MEAAVGSLLKSIVPKMILSGVGKLTANAANAYQLELHKIIFESIHQYEEKFPIEETDQIPFYKSETLFTSLIEFRLTSEFDIDAISLKLSTDARVIQPTEEQLLLFFEIFDGLIHGNEKLAGLNIENNYKEEIFKLNPLLKKGLQEIKDEITSLKNDLQSFGTDGALQVDWERQLNEVADDLTLFKAFSAKRRLESLKAAIQLSGANNKPILAKLITLETTTLQLLIRPHHQEDGDERAKLQIQAFNLVPGNLDYKNNASLAYLALGELEIAQKLNNEAVEEDGFNITSRLVQCFLAKESYQTILDKIPQSVKNKEQFRLNLYSWISSRNPTGGLDEIENIGLSPVINVTNKIEINYTNFRYWLNFHVYILNKCLGKENTISAQINLDHLKENDHFRFAFVILSAIMQKLKGSEVEHLFITYAFYYHYIKFALFQQESDILDMEKYFLQLENKSDEYVVKMIQGYNSIGEEKYFKKSIEIGKSYIEKNIKDRDMYLILSVTSLLNKEITAHVRYLFDYLNLAPTISNGVFQNSAKFLTEPSFVISGDTRQEWLELIMGKVPEALHYQQILRLILFLTHGIGEFTHDQIKAFLRDTRDITPIQEKNSCYIIACALAQMEMLDEAKEYIEKVDDLKLPSNFYILYCKILYNLNVEKAGLLGLLRKFRESTNPDHELLRMEINLMKLQQKKQETEYLAKIGFNTFPASQYFLYEYLEALNSTGDSSKIEELLPITNTFSFTDESIIVRLAAIFINNGFFEFSLDYLFQYAQDKSNAQVRQAYIFLSHHYPEGLMKDFDEIMVGRFAKLNAKGTITIQEFTEESSIKHPTNLFINKHRGETVFIDRTISRQIDAVLIVRVMDKYLALFEEIYEESKSPLSGMTLQGFEYPNSGPEEMIQHLIENFGVQGSERQEQINEDLEAFHQAHLSFSEVTRRVFNSNPVDCYFFLTSQKGKPFRALSPAIGHTSFSGASFVLDATSLCLFYMLHKEKGMHFEHKFFISPYLRKFIEDELTETSNNDYTLSFTITKDRVMPHFYDDQFKNRRINTFQSLLEWIRLNCIEADIPERLHWVVNIEPKIQHDTLFNILLDNRLMLDRPSNILLTNDSIYLKSFGANKNTVISPICYLSSYFPQHQSVYLQHMLEYNYLGIPVMVSTLQDEFFKMLSGQENHFLMAVENLDFGWNPEIQNLSTAIAFVKSIYINPILPNDVKFLYMEMVFKRIARGMNEHIKVAFMRKLEKSFLMLGTYKDTVVETFKRTAHF